MYKFSKPKNSASYFDMSTINYTYGKVNGSIISDIDNNGFVDIVTFPSVFDTAIPKNPLVWSNNGSSFSANPSLIKTDFLTVQYYRDTVKGDFNGDGYLDFFQLDQGWELNDRNPDFYQGAHPALFLGSSNGLTYVPTVQWMLGQPRNTFNHIGATADFDKDGDLDLVVAAFWDFRIYENDGNAKFSWKKNLLPTEFISDQSLPPGVTNGAQKSVSGTTFINLGGEYALVAGFYRSYNSFDLSGTLNPEVLKFTNGQFIKISEIPKPNLGGREINYGATDMYNVDINGDGREDLLIHWETEAVGGVDDGHSVIVDGVYGGATSRYTDLSDNLVTVYLQNERGDLVITPKIYNMAGRGLGHLYFDDINGDGNIDFWNTSYGILSADVHKVVWLGDGRGGFSNPEPGFFKFEQTFDHDGTPHFIDVDNNGSLDVVVRRGLFGSDYATRNIGEELVLFLNDTTTSPYRKLNGLSTNYEVTLDDRGIVTVNGLGLDLRMAAVERLSFVDSNLAFDIDGVAGQAYRLYKAAFDRAPDLPGLGFWIKALDSGAALTTAAGGFIASPEFQNRYGSVNDTDFIRLLYENVLDRQPDADGYAFWQRAMAEGLSREGLLINFSESPENKGNVAGLIAGGIEYTPFIG